MTIVITISGPAGHGKDTAAVYIKNRINSILSLAFTEDGHEIPLKEYGYVAIMHYAAPIKMLAREAFGWDGEKDVKGRHLLQWLGTDLVRSIDHDFWVKTTTNMMDMLSNEFMFFIIPDTRYPNEIQYLRSKGYKVLSLSVVRDDFESDLTESAKKHVSENALNDFLFDLNIHVRGGVENLYKQLDPVVRKVISLSINQENLIKRIGGPNE